MRDLGIGRFVRQVGIAVGAAWLIAAYPLYAHGSPRLVWSLAAGCGICVLNAIAGCAAIAWAFRRTGRDFFKTVFGSMGIRMALIGAAFFLLVGYTDIHVSGFVGSLFGSYVVLQTMEVLFLIRRLPGLKQEQPQ